MAHSGGFACRVKCPSLTDHDVAALRQRQQRGLGRVVVEEPKRHIRKLRKICEGGLRRGGGGGGREEAVLLAVWDEALRVVPISGLARTMLSRQ